MPEGELWVECHNWTDGIRRRLAKKWKITDCCICIFTRTCLHDNKGVLVELSCALCQQWAGLWQNEEAVCADTIDALCSNTLEADRFLVMYLLNVNIVFAMQCCQHQTWTELYALLNFDFENKNIPLFYYQRFRNYATVLIRETGFKKKSWKHKFEFT